MNKRIIKNENNFIKNKEDKTEIIEMKPGKQLLHPIFNTWINTKDITNPICLTKFQMQNKKFKYINEYKCQSSNDNYKKFMYIPPIGITSESVLDIYDISSIDILNNWINDNINKLSYFTINRVLNCWIRNNFDILKNYNNSLEKIYSNLANTYSSDKIKKKIDNGNIDINKESKYFIDYWIGKKNSNDFAFDLLSEYIDYLAGKYNI